MESINIVDAVLAGDKETFMQAFNAALADKVTDALEVKKVELASTLLMPQEFSQETTEVATHEVEGSTEHSDGSQGE